MFDPGFSISPTQNPMGFVYGGDVFGPSPENRTLSAIRKSLRDPHCDGPDPVYSIVMDVGKKQHYDLLVSQHLLYGAVTYAAGRLGQEPVRSQGHVHKKSAHSGLSTPEVYEIWSGSAVILMQESDADDPGRCFAVIGKPGDVVIVPPDWAHATISADPEVPLTFGAFCDRDYGFMYDGVRSHGGLAHFPLLSEDGALSWQPNPAYLPRALTIKRPEPYAKLGLEAGIPLYTQYEKNPERFLFVCEPQRAAHIWPGFVP